MNEALQIASTKRPLLSKSQNGLLKIMVECVHKNEALTFEQLVYCYSENVNKDIEWPYYNSSISGHPIHKGPHNVIECYKAQNAFWQWKIRGLIKSWFISAIGLLVIKGFLTVIPNIQIEN